MNGFSPREEGVVIFCPHIISLSVTRTSWLTCVASPVVRQHVVLGKSGITEVTGERFLSSVDPGKMGK